MGLTSMAVCPGAKFLVIYRHTVVLQLRTVVSRMMVPLATPAKVALTLATMAITASSSTETETQGV